MRQPQKSLYFQCGTVTFLLVLSSIVDGVVKGGSLHCILWLRPESAYWFVRSKYLNV